MSVEQAGQFIPTDGLTPAEDEQLAKLLSKWGGGRLSTPVFTQVARIIPQPIIEVVFFRGTGGNIETLLIPRPLDDIVWPGMVHTPGTALRRSDFDRADRNPLNGAFERILWEVKQNEFAYPPTFVARLHRLVERGPEVAEIYVSGLLEEATLQPDKFWYPVNGLASNPNFTQAQLGHVVLAANFYASRIIRS